MSSAQMEACPKGQNQSIIHKDPCSALLMGFTNHAIR